MYYKYKNDEYIVLNNEIKFKHPQTREWINSVLYRSLSTGEEYVREFEEFKYKFKEITDLKTSYETNSNSY